MKESTTYQGILEDGRQEGLQQGRQQALRAILLQQGRQKFGLMNESINATITAISDVERLERMTDRMLVASNWDELLATP